MLSSSKKNTGKNILKKCSWNKKEGKKNLLFLFFWHSHSQVTLISLSMPSLTLHFALTPAPIRRKQKQAAYQRILPVTEEFKDA